MYFNVAVIPRTSSPRHLKLLVAQHTRLKLLTHNAQVARKRAVVESDALLSVLSSVEDLGKHGSCSAFYMDFRLTQLAKLYSERPGNHTLFHAC